LFLIINMIGLGLGPLAVGFLSDQLAPHAGDGALRLAILMVVSVGTVWSCIHYVLAARTLSEDLSNAPD
jgi:hypothetical protein